MLDIKGNDQIRRVYGEAPCLQTMQGGNREPKIQVIGNLYQSGHEAGNIYEKSGISATVKCNGPRPNSKNQAQKIIENHRIRKLTPKECWRLQGFPDWSHDKAKADGVSDSQLYKQAGNSITVDVMMYLIQSIFEPNTKESLF